MFYPHVWFPAQLAEGTTLSSILDKPSSQLPSMLCGTCLHFYRCSSVFIEFCYLPPRGPDPLRSDADERSAISVNGGDFMCRCTQNGAFLFAGDGARVKITGGLVESNVADGRGGAVYCSGDSTGAGGSRVAIEGGTFRNNSALELGGVIVAWGAPTVVTITGGVFSGNYAK